MEWRVIPGRAAPNRSVAWKALRKGCRGQPGCESCARWAFKQIDYAAPGRKRSGHDWDADGSAPDITLSIQVGADRRGTSKKQDHRRGTWPLAPPLEVAAGERVTIVATDADLVANDRISSHAERVPATLKDGVFSFGAGSVVLRGACLDP